MVVGKYFVVLISVVCLSYGAMAKHSREIVHDSWTSKEKLEIAIDTLEKRNDALSMAYLGLCESMMASHVIWPGSKLEYFNKGKKRIEDACLRDIWNAEIRYIRLMVQLNAPSFLGYNVNIESDFDVFCKYLMLEKFSNEWKWKFVGEMLKIKKLSKTKSATLEKLREQIKK
jgi:hypothetical protein